MKMGKKLVAARDLPAGHVLTDRRHRDEVARRRHAARTELDALRRRDAAPAGDEDAALTFELLERAASPSSAPVERRGLTSSNGRRVTRRPAPLDGRVAVVTGAAASSARSGSTRCSTPGRRVVGLDLPRTRRRAGRPALTSPSCDVTDRAARRGRGRGEVAERCGAARRCWSTTPASTSRPTPRPARYAIEDMPLEDVRRTIEVNLRRRLPDDPGLRRARWRPTAAARSSTSARSTPAVAPDPRLLRPPATPTRRSSSRPPTAPRRPGSST